MTSNTSNTAASAPAGTDFSKLTPIALALAAQHGMEIVGSAAGFNAYKDGDILSSDCTPSEIEQWLQGYGNGRDDALPEVGPKARGFTDIEFSTLLDHVVYRGWSSLTDHRGMTITGPNFVTLVKNSAEFFAFIHGYNAAGAVLDMLGTGAPIAEGDDE